MCWVYLPTPMLPWLQAQHLVASEAPLRRAATFSNAPRALMTFRGCPRPLGATIVLRGSDAAGKRLRHCLRSSCACPAASLLADCTQVSALTASSTAVPPPQSYAR